MHQSKTRIRKNGKREHFSIENRKNTTDAFKEKHQRQNGTQWSETQTPAKLTFITGEDRFTCHVWL